MEIPLKLLKPPIQPHISYLGSTSDSPINNNVYIERKRDYLQRSFWRCHVQLLEATVQPHASSFLTTSDSFINNLYTYINYIYIYIYKTLLEISCVSAETYIPAKI